MPRSSAYTGTDRAYRRACASRPGEHAFQVIVGESDVHVIACCDLRAEIAALLTRLRAELQNWIILHPEFRDSLVPLDIPPHAPALITRMYEAAHTAGVGPFAAVAGAIAQAVAEALAHKSPELIVENGGDTYICSTVPRRVGLLSDPQGMPLLSVEVAADECPVSFCASSGKIGHSLSFGTADLVVVRAKNAALADACATALANIPQKDSDISTLLEYGKNIPGLEGIFAHHGGKIGLWGKMELV